MIDPPRLKVASRHPISRVLLESALEDHSAPGAAERALQALSVGTGVAAAAVAMKASASMSIGGQWVGLVVLKWLGLGLVAGATTLLSAEYALNALSRGSQAVAVAPAPRQGTPTPPNTHPVVAASPPLVSSEPPPLPELAPHEPGPAARSPELAEATAQAVGPAGAPLDQLRAIRAALAAHAPARALLLLDAFERQYPGSSLSEETAVLRVDALVSLGRNGDARALGEDFLRRYPRSAYAERVRAQLRLP
jgi:hypothetical protein